ncbi:hypothetical protein NS506_01961 [Nocardia seriolae]|uniref:Uncharacterized protein n=2 Tax=Nocardia seriolae TaxID=37332 RepID=A0ABC8APH6_9NOCA|nr:hypothetical protein NS506_01961 [Nocardia seriolae]
MPVRHRTRLPAPRSPSDGIRCGPSTTGEHFSGVGQRPVSNWAIAALSVEPPVTAAASATGDSNPMFVRRLVPLLFSHRQDSSPAHHPTRSSSAGGDRVRFRRWRLRVRGGLVDHHRSPSDDVLRRILVGCGVSLRHMDIDGNSRVGEIAVKVDRLRAVLAEDPGGDLLASFPPGVELDPSRELDTYRRQMETRVASGRLPAVAVGSATGAVPGLPAGPFPVAARRTGRAVLAASGSP